MKVLFFLLKNKYLAAQQDILSTMGASTMEVGLP